MAELRKIEPYVGAVVVGCLASLLALTIAFAANFLKFGHPIGGLAVASVVLGCLALSGILFVGGRRVYYERNGQMSKSAQWRIQKTTLVTAILLVIWSIFSISTFIWILCAREGSIPGDTLGMPSRYLVYIALILWIILGFSQALYITEIAHAVRNELSLSQTNTIDEEGQHPSDTTGTTDTKAEQSKRSNKISIDFGSIGSMASSRKRSESDTRSSIRDSFSNAIRPISSKSRLIGYKYNPRPTSKDSGTGERECQEEGFDSWDTSTAEVPPWRSTLTPGVTNSSPISTIAAQHPRILETIPASPSTSSRSQSPADPLDFPPPQVYARRSRSQSPASFRKARSEKSGSHSPARSEKHIHPLFRSDSPTPPPSASATSTITAAPNAGQVLSDLTAVRRKRSGSLQASSPLVHSTSFDNIALASVRESKSQGGDTAKDEKSVEDSSPVVDERSVIPPIPEWILGADQRTSFHEYAKRKSVKGGQIGG